MYANIPVPRVIIRKKAGSVSAQPKKKRAVLMVKAHSHPWENRADLSDTYELPVTDREEWWRATIRVTPAPGTYELIDFIEDLTSRPNTYSFKSKRRNTIKDLSRNGLYLLPGGSEYMDFLQLLAQKPATYRFKAEERYAQDVLNMGLKDKDINIPSTAYNCEKYLAIDGETSPVKSYMFRSQSKRLPSQVFRLKDGPAPGSYSVKDVNRVSTAITSSFRSKVPRFKSSVTVLPSAESRNLY